MGAGMNQAAVAGKYKETEVATSALKTPAGVPDGSYPGMPRWVEQLLRIPLPMKLVGANAFLLIAAMATAAIVRGSEISTAPVLTVVSAAFVTALLVNIALVTLAVRPIHVLEKTVDMIWHGNLDARVPTSLVADRHLARVARMFNIMLDGLVADRARTRRLAAELINTGDRERAAMSRELHDSTAQSLAALVMQLSVVAQSTDSVSREVLKEQIEGARFLATTTLEEVRLLAHTMHPRVLDDLGLVAALRRLARETSAHASSYGSAAGEGGMQETVLVNVIAREGNDRIIPAVTASVLYRVAQEAVQNARRHAGPKHIEIRVWTDGDTAMLEVSDDGIGFDPEAVRPDQAGIGLFTIRERVALVDGELRVTSRPGGGTSVVASVPYVQNTPFI